MNIFADIDYNKTAKRVNILLKYKLPKLVVRCGISLTDLSSPKLSLAPSHSNQTDGQEKMLINSFSIENVVNAIYETINHCPNVSKTILIDNYIRNYSVNRTLMDIPYEQAYYYRKLKPKALNEFADLYDHYQNVCNVDPEDIIDLHVYK